MTFLDFFSSSGAAKKQDDFIRRINFWVQQRFGFQLYRSWLFQLWAKCAKHPEKDPSSVHPNSPRNLDSMDSMGNARRKSSSSQWPCWIEAGHGTTSMVLTLAEVYALYCFKKPFGWHICFAGKFGNNQKYNKKYNKCSNNNKKNNNSTSSSNHNQQPT